MEKPVDMQKFMDNVIDNFYAGFAHLLACHIKDEGFTAPEYKTADEIIPICNIAINCLLNTFERVVSE